MYINVLERLLKRFCELIHNIDLIVFNKLLKSLSFRVYDNYGLKIKKEGFGEMDIILGVGTLVLVLIIMTLFLNFAPYGKQGLQALSGAACATFYHRRS